MRKVLDLSEVEYASFPQRIGGGVLDFFFVVFLFSVFLSVTGADVDPKEIENAKSLTSIAGIDGWILALPVLYLAYCVPSLSLNGVTLGKRIMGINVVRTDGKIGIGLDRALLREVIPLLVLIIPLINFLFLIMIFWFFVDPQRQNIPDKIAKTYVIRTPQGLYSDNADTQPNG